MRRGKEETQFRDITKGFNWRQLPPQWLFQEPKEFLLVAQRWLRHLLLLWGSFWICLHGPRSLPPSSRSPSGSMQSWRPAWELRTRMVRVSLCGMAGMASGPESSGLGFSCKNLLGTHVYSILKEERKKLWCWVEPLHWAWMVHPGHLQPWARSDSGILDEPRGTQAGTQKSFATGTCVHRFIGVFNEDQGTFKDQCLGRERNGPNLLLTPTLLPNGLLGSPFPWGPQSFLCNGGGFLNCSTEPCGGWEARGGRGGAHGAPRPYLGFKGRRNPSGL